MSENKNRFLYKKLCAMEKTIPIFLQDWWLDAACSKENWDVCLVEKKGTVLAAMPYILKKRGLFTLITQPPLTQFLGPWLRPSPKKYAKALAEEKKLMQALISQLPSFDFFSQNWHHSRANWLPFYWSGFKQTSRYTYVLKKLADKEKIWATIQENLRREIRKAINRYGLRVRNDLGIEDFLPLNKLTFKRQNLKQPYSDDFVRKLDATCAARNCRRIFIAEDDKGRHHAGVYIVWDKNSAYYLMGGGNPQLRNSGATSLCMWEAIKFTATVTKQFDFEGSMIEPVERFFRAFGAVQTPYFNITKTNSRLLRLRQCAKELSRR